jgi:hypothetical protein
VGRLGDPPRNRPLRAVPDLARHHETAAEIQQAARGLPHHEKRHEVLEHGARPGDEGCTSPHWSQGPAQQEPVPGRDVALGDRHEAAQPRLGGQQVVAAGLERAVGHAIADGEQLPRGVEQEPEVHGGGHPFGAECEGRELVPKAGLRFLGRLQTLEKQGRFEVASVARNAVPHALRPHQDLGSGPLLALARERVRNVHEVLRLVLQLLDPAHPFGKRRRGIAESRRNSFRGLAQMRLRDRLRTPRRLGLLLRVENQSERVPDSLQGLRAEQRAMHEFAARLRHGDQVPCQIAAVDGGNVDGIERSQVSRVVPVEEMATEAPQARHGIERILEPFRHVEDPDPAEVVGDGRTQQVETQIGRRGAVGDGWLGVFLEVVRRERVVLFTHERLEETPGAAGDQA